MNTAEKSGGSPDNAWLWEFVVRKEVEACTWLCSRLLPRLRQALALTNSGSHRMTPFICAREKQGMVRGSPERKCWVRSVHWGLREGKEQLGVSDWSGEGRLGLGTRDGSRARVGCGVCGERQTQRGCPQVWPVLLNGWQ